MDISDIEDMYYDEYGIPIVYDEYGVPIDVLDAYENADFAI